MSYQKQFYFFQEEGFMCEVVQQLMSGLVKEDTDIAESEIDESDVSDMAMAEANSRVIVYGYYVHVDGRIRGGAQTCQA